MAGGIVHVFYGAIPPYIAEEIGRVLDDRLKGIVQRFMERSGVWMGETVVRGHETTREEAGL